VWGVGNASSLYEVCPGLFHVRRSKALGFLLSREPNPICGGGLPYTVSPHRRRRDSLCRIEGLGRHPYGACDGPW